MFSPEKAKSSTDAIRNGNEFISAGREWQVHSDAGNNLLVHKTAQELVSGQGFVTHIDDEGYVSMITYDIETVPTFMRRFLISQHILGKVLHLLYPHNVPDRFSIKTKAYPRFSQEFVDGGGIGTKVEYKKRVNKEQGDVSGGRFRIIRNTEYTKEPTDFGQQALDEWNKRVDLFVESLARLGILVDTNNKEANFIVDNSGNDMYVDSFDFEDPVFVATSLLKEVDRRRKDGVIKDDVAKNVSIWIKRFEKINK